MSNFNQNTGTDPQGEKTTLPVGGDVFPTFQGIVNPGKSIDTGWFATERFVALGFVYFSDKQGRYTIEYSNDQQTLFTPIIPVDYVNGDVGIRRKGGIDPDAKWCRITWYNTSDQPAQLSMRVKLSPGLMQPSLETLAAKGAGTRLGQWVKAKVDIPNASGEYDEIMRTGNAMNVHLDQPITLDTSALAKDQTLTNGTQTVKIVDGNNVAFGTTTRPLNVTVSNPTAAPATQTVNGTVNIGNLPATQPVSGTVAISNPVTTIGVNNFPATQQVSGTVTVANPVSTVAVSNLPATQPVSIAGVVQVSSIPTATGGYPIIGIWQPATAAFFTNIVTGTRKMGVLVISNTLTQSIALTLYDQAAVPTTSSTPTAVYVAQANSTLAIPLADGLHFNNGIGMAVMAGSASILNIVGGLLTLVTAGQIKVSYAIV